MILEMNEVDTPPLAELLLAEIPEDGSSIGNIRLRKKLGWDPSTYTKIRESLIRDGVLVRAGGQGGSLKRQTQNGAASRTDASSLDGQCLLKQLPTDGSALSNPRLMKLLRWKSDHYWSVRDQLVDSGKVELGRGRGGTVRRVVFAGAKVPPQVRPQSGRTQFSSERSLYPPMKNVISADWAKDQRIAPIVVETTAQQGRRHTGGRYTRPDIVIVHVKTYEFLPEKRLELITFEIKPHNAIDVACIYEALAHKQAATRSYVLLHVPDGAENKVDLEVLESAAGAHGIGLIVAEDPADYATWETRLDARRHEPDPARLNEFIKTQLSPEAKSKLTAAIR